MLGVNLIRNALDNIVPLKAAVVADGRSNGELKANKLSKCYELSETRSSLPWRVSPHPPIPP